MYCVSISHKTCGVEIRKKLAFSPQLQAHFLSKALSFPDIDEALVLCTCNRTEVYCCGQKSSVSIVEEMLEQLAEMNLGEIKKYVCLFYGGRALKHLFEVACGMDSAVIGEDEILGQLKRAYAFARENGAAGAQLNMSMQAAVACAKKTKTETAISKSAVSLATLAANEAAHFKNGETEVLLIGASGKTGQTVAKNLVSHKNISLTVTKRTHGGSVSELETLGAAVISYADRYNAIDKADCVISATLGPHYTVTFGELKKDLKAHKKRLFIDLAVPPDIDPDVIKADGARLLDIDCLNGLARENNIRKLSSVESARLIMEEELDELKKRLAFREFLPYIKKLEAKDGGRGVGRFIYRLKKELAGDEFVKVLETYKKYKEDY